MTPSRVVAVYGGDDRQERSDGGVILPWERLETIRW